MAADARNGAAIGPTHEGILCDWVKPKVAYVLTRLGVIDALMPLGTKKTPAQIAVELNLPSVKPLSRVMRTGAWIGLLAQHADGFAATVLGSVLSKDHFSKMRSFLLSWNLPVHSSSLNKLYEAVKADTSGVTLVYGPETKHLFHAMYKDPEELAIFDDFMSSTVGFSTAAALAFDYSGCGKVVDVGGCQGALVEAILKAHPGLTGVNFDRPEVISTLPPVKAELAGRLTHVAGDFFAPFPPEVCDADAMVLKFIMHDWADTHNVAILKNCAAALAPGGKIVVVDILVPDVVSGSQERGPASIFPYTLDMVMLAVTEGGQERELSEWHALFTAAGLAPPVVLHNEQLACLVSEPVA